MTVCFQRVALVLALVLGSLIAGCETAEPDSQVSGKVVYKGEPVTEGRVNLVNPQSGAAAVASLDPAGMFTIPGGLTPGKYKVYISPPQSEPLPPGQKPPKPKAIGLPKRVTDASTSDLEVTLSKGKNDVTIDVKP